MPHNLDELVHVHLLIVLDREYFSEQGAQKELKLAPMLVGGRKNQERFLLYAYFLIVAATVVQVIELALSENKGA